MQNKIDKMGHGLEPCQSVPTQAQLVYFEEKGSLPGNNQKCGAATPTAIEWNNASIDAQILITGIQYRFNCSKCGACCASINGVEVLEPDIPRMALALGMDVEAFRDQYLRQLVVEPEFQEYEKQLEEVTGPRFELKGATPCHFFDAETNSCKIEEDRPAGCRGKPFLTGETLWIDPKTKTVIIRNVPLCSASIGHLKEMERSFNGMQKIIKETKPQWTEEQVTQQRRIGVSLWNMVLLGREKEIGTICDRQPRDVVFLLASFAYDRLISSGWKVIFDHIGDRVKAEVNAEDLIEHLPEDIKYAESLFGIRAEGGSDANKAI